MIRRIATLEYSILGPDSVLEFAAKGRSTTNARNSAWTDIGDWPETSNVTHVITPRNLVLTQDDEARAILETISLRQTAAKSFHSHRHILTHCSCPDHEFSKRSSLDLFSSLCTFH